MRDIHVTEATPETRASVLGFLLGGGPGDGRAARALDMLARGELAPPTVLLARGSSDGELLGAALCQVIPGGNAVVWVPQALASPDRPVVEDVLAGGLLDHLRRAGVKAAQLFLKAGEEASAATLVRHGFRHTTRVWQMRCDLAGGVPIKPDLPSSPVRLIPYPECDPRTFGQTLLHTYEGTLDCPELNGVRSPEEVLAGHRAGAPDIARWWLAERDGRPAGVLLLATGGEPGEWEVSYMGVMPAARRKGVARALLRHAKSRAAAAGVGSLTLLVDARNEPALSLYRAHGFRIDGVREVFLKIGL